MRARAWWIVVAALAGCNPDEESTAGGPCPTAHWRRDDGVCVTAGLPPDLPCPPGEWLREADGACIAAGVPPDGCAAGFAHDGDRGCEPILPAEPCPGRLMAVPGETSCREVAPCGEAPYGDVPIEPGTQHVDG